MTFVSITTFAIYIPLIAMEKTTTGLAIRTESSTIPEDIFIKNKNTLLENPEELIDSFHSDSKKIRAFDITLQRRELITEKNTYTKVPSILNSYIFELCAYHMVLGRKIREEAEKFLGKSIAPGFVLEDEFVGLYAYTSRKNKKRKMSIVPENNVLKINIEPEMLEKYRNDFANAKTFFGNKKRPMLSKYCGDRYKNGFKCSYLDMIQKLRNYKVNESKNNPISSTDECTLTCFLSRWYNPHIRKNAENCIVQNTNDPNTTVFYASGRLFQELVILTKLMNNGKIPNFIILIDPLYERIISTAKIPNNNNNSITLSQNFDQSCTQSENKIENIKHEIDDRLTYNALISFSNWLSNLYKKQPQIILYKSAEDYINDCKTNPKLRYNLLIGFDFFELNQNKVCTQEYKGFLEIKKHALAKAAQYYALTKREFSLNPQPPFPGRHCLLLYRKTA